MNFFFMESISNVKVATNLKKEAKKVQRPKTFFLLKYHLLLFSAVFVNQKKSKSAAVRGHPQSHLEIVDSQVVASMLSVNINLLLTCSPALVLGVTR